MVKVLMCGNSRSNKGGMTTVISQILEHNWEEDDIQIKFIPTYYRGGKLLTISFFVFAYIRVLFAFILYKPDVFYTHMSVRGSFTRTKLLHNLSVKKRVPDIIHLHGSEFEVWYNGETDSKKAEIKKLIDECFTFVVLGQKWEKFVKNIAPNARIKQIHNCIKIPKETVAWNKEVHFIFLGVLIPRKGIFDLLKAIKALKEENKIENCVFDIAGTGSEEKELKDYVVNNNLEENVSFLGWVSGQDKEIAIKKSNVFILPSYNEGLPVSILEAMSYGLPIISTCVGDIPDAVKEGKNGYLFEPGDISSLAECIIKVKQKDTWEILSKNARDITEKEFNIDYFYSELKSIFKSGIK